MALSTLAPPVRVDITPEPAVFIGVDTRDFHVAVALNGQGAVLGEMHLPARSAGYEALLDWTGELAGADCTDLLFGIEGIGSYGAGLCHFLQIAGCQVREVNRPNRQARRQRGKDDSIDAELAARALIAGTASAIAKTRNAEAEMLRIRKSTRDSAVRCRTKAITQLKALLISAPAHLRESLEQLSTADLIVRCQLNPGSDVCCSASATSRALHVLATRIHHLEQEIADLGHDLDRTPKPLLQLSELLRGLARKMLLPSSSRPETILSVCDRRPPSPHSAVRPQSLPVQVTATDAASIGAGIDRRTGRCFGLL
jgi:hypothetical protein